MADILIPGELSPHVIRWTREDCKRFEEAGALNYQYELIEGMINKMGQNMPHASIVFNLLIWLAANFGAKFVVTQASIDVKPEDTPTSEPLPDAIVLTRPAGDFTSYPKPSEIRLLVEVSDTTLRFDLTTKAALYARAEIVEYWVVDVNAREVTVFHSPENGRYFDAITYRGDQEVSSLSVGEKSVLVSSLFN